MSVSLTEFSAPLTSFIEEGLDLRSMSEKVAKPLEERIIEVATSSIQEDADHPKSSLEGKKYWLIDGLVAVREINEKSTYTKKLLKKHPFLRFMLVPIILSTFVAGVHFVNFVIPFALVGLAIMVHIVLDMIPVYIPKSSSLAKDIAKIRQLGYEQGFHKIQKEALGFDPKLPCDVFHPEELRYLYMKSLIDLEKQSSLENCKKEKVAFTVFQSNLFGRALLGSLDLIGSSFARDLSDLNKRFENRRLELYERFDKKYLWEIENLKVTYQDRINSVIYWRTETHYMRNGTSHTAIKRDYLQEEIEKKRLKFERDYKIKLKHKAWSSHYASFFNEAKAFLEEVHPYANQYLNDLNKGEKQTDTIGFIP